MGLDVDGEDANTKFSIPIKYCPFCGKKLSEQSKPKIYVYIIRPEKDNEFVKSNEDLSLEVNYERRKYRDRYDDWYYLYIFVEHAIRKHLEKTVKSFYKLYSGDWYYSNMNKSEVKTKEYRTTLKEGCDIFIGMSEDCSQREYVMERLQKLGTDIVLINSGDLKLNKDNNIIIPKLDNV